MPPLIDKQYSPPPSPNPSETLSLPDVISDLENLSDYSGLSVSDEDERVSYVNTDSDHEAQSEWVMEEMSPSMASSYIHLPAPRAFDSDKTRMDRATSTDRDYVAISRSGSQASLSSSKHGPSTPSSSYITTRTLQFPYAPTADEIEDHTFPDMAHMKESRGESHFSIIDLTKSSSSFEQPSAAQSVHEDVLMEGSATTIMQRSIDNTPTPMMRSVSFTSGARSRSERFPSFAGSWPSDGSDISSDADVDDEVDDGTTKSFSTAANAQPASSPNQTPRMSRWRNVQALGVFGVVLLSIAAYHQKALPYNISSIEVHNPSSSAAKVGFTELDAVKVALETFAAISPVVHQSLPPSSASASTDGNLGGKALVYISPLDDVRTATTFGSTKVGLKDSIATSMHSKEEVINELLSSTIQNDSGPLSSSLSVRTGYSGVTALATLPRRAKKGLSILTARSVCSECRGGAKKLKSRRKVLTGSHADIHRSRQYRMKRSVIEETQKAPKAKYPEPFPLPSLPLTSKDFARGSKRNPKITQQGSCDRPAGKKLSSSPHGTQGVFAKKMTLADLVTRSRSVMDGMLIRVDGCFERVLGHILEAFANLDYRTLWIKSARALAMYHEAVSPFVKAVESSVEEQFHTASQRFDVFAKAVSGPAANVSHAMYDGSFQSQEYVRDILLELYRGIRVEIGGYASQLRSFKKRVPAGKFSQYSKFYLARAQRNSRGIVHTLRSTFHHQISAIDDLQVVHRLRTYLAAHRDLIIIP